MAFDGFAGGVMVPLGEGEPGVMPARSWLLTTGWRRHRLIDPFEVPRCEQKTANRSPAKKKVHA